MCESKITRKFAETRKSMHSFCPTDKANKISNKDRCSIVNVNLSPYQKMVCYSNCYHSLALVQLPGGL